MQRTGRDQVCGFNWVAIKFCALCGDTPFALASRKAHVKTKLCPSGISRNTLLVCKGGVDKCVPQSQRPPPIALVFVPPFANYPLGMNSPLLDEYLSPSWLHLKLS